MGKHKAESPSIGFSAFTTKNIKENNDLHQGKPLAHNKYLYNMRFCAVIASLRIVTLQEPSCAIPPAHHRFLPTYQ